MVSQDLQLKGADTSTTRLKCNGFETWIIVDEKELKKYGADADDTGPGRVASCWIASQTDKEFSVHIRKTANTRYDWKCKVYLDGNLVKTKKVQKNSRRIEIVVNYVRTSQTETRKFVFGSVELTDDDTLLESGTLSSTTGEIKVTIERGTAKIRDCPKSRTTFGFSIPEAGKVHERSKKGLIHQVKFGEICLIPPKGSARPSYSFEAQETLATFVFRYRPFEMLQANGIAPYTTPHVPQAARQDTMRSALDMLKSRKRKVAEIKIEIDKEEIGGGDDDDDDDDVVDDIISMTQALREDLDKLEKKIAGHRKKKVKTEASERAPGLIHGEVIDLTL